MIIQVEVPEEVLQAWKGMAKDLEMPLDAFFRCCVRTAGPRLLRTYGDIARRPHLNARATSYSHQMREEEP